MSTAKPEDGPMRLYSLSLSPQHVHRPEGVRQVNHLDRSPEYGTLHSTRGRCGHAMQEATIQRNNNQYKPAGRRQYGVGRTQMAETQVTNAPPKSGGTPTQRKQVLEDFQPYTSAVRREKTEKSRPILDHHPLYVQPSIERKPGVRHRQQQDVCLKVGSW